MHASLKGMNSGPTPTQLPKNEAEYARKLALAILSTLESKGLLSKLDVDTILHVAHRAALQAQAEAEKAEDAETETTENAEEGSENALGESPKAKETGLNTQSETESSDPQEPTTKPTPSVLTAPIEVKRPLGPAVLGTRWVKPDAPTPEVAAPQEFTHDPGAVRVVGQSPAKDRPLAPAILSGTKSEPEPAPAQPTEEKPVSPEDAARNLQNLESRVQDQHKADPGGKEKDRTDSPLVIDLNLD